MELSEVTGNAGKAVDISALGVEVINNLRGVEVGIATYNAALAAASATSGVDFSKVALDKLSDDEALTRFVSLKRGFGENERFDRVKRGGGEAIYTYNVRAINASLEEAQWTPSGDLRYSRPPGQIQGALNAMGLPGDVAARAVAAYNFYRVTFMTPDLTEFLAKVIMRCGGIKLRESGGVFFVPRSGLVEVKVVIDMIRGLTSPASIGIINIADEPTGEHRAVVETAARDEFEAAVVAATAARDEFVRARIEALEDDSKRGPRDSAGLSRLKEVKALANKVGLYSDLLQIKMEDTAKLAADLQKFWEVALGIA